MEFDFDSDPGDIRAGAIAIPASFMRTAATPDVTGEILNSQGTVVAAGSANCRTR